MNLLDTDTIIKLLHERKHETAATSIITLIEVLRGLETKKRPKVKGLLEESFHVLNLDNQAVETYCNMYRKLKKKGKSIHDADLLIAATAVSHDMTLKTRDKHFKILKEFGLKLAQTTKKH